jgi:hypothetical protein
MLNKNDKLRRALTKKTAAHLAIDHIHSRAICDEIGERLSYMLKKDASEVPAYLLRLISRLDEQDGALPIVSSPSIAPSFDEISRDEQEVNVDRANARFLATAEF